VEEKLKRLSEILLTDDRKNIDHPNKVEDYTCFTEGHILFCVKTNLISLIDFCTCMENRIKEFGWIPLNEDKWNKVTELSISELSDVFKDVPVFRRDTKIKCEKCEGSGVEDCTHCGSELNCIDCDGSGFTLTPGEGTFLEPKPDTVFKFGERYWDSVKLYRSVRALEELFSISQKIEFFTSKNNSNNLMLKGDDFIIVIMALNPDYYETLGRKIIFEIE